MWIIIDLLLPDLKSKVEKKQWESNFYKNYGYGPKQIPGTTESCTGPLSCTVLIGNGQVVRRHVDQIRKWELSGVPDIDPSTPQAVSIPFPGMPEQVQFPEVRVSDSATHVEDSESDPPMLGSESPPVLQEQHP